MRLPWRKPEGHLPHEVAEGRDKVLDLAEKLKDLADQLSDQTDQLLDEVARTSVHREGDIDY